MATRYPRFSYNDEALAPAVGTEARQLLQGGVTTGRVFWLRGISATNTDAAAGDLWIYDEVTEAAPTATNQRLELYISATSTMKFEFAAPGIKFVTGVNAGTAAHALDGAFAAYGVTIWGYEE